MNQSWHRRFNQSQHGHDCFHFGVTPRNSFTSCSDKSNMLLPKLDVASFSQSSTKDAERVTLAKRTKYTLVHVVATEMMKDLIIPQVIEHMVQQANTPGPMRPSRVVVVFMEPVRVVMRRAVRLRLREIRRDAPSLRIILLPYVSRLGQRTSARVLGRVLREIVGRLPVVLHCRGEAAVEWASHLGRYFDRAGIVADIRGAWPEELLSERGFDGPEEADAPSRAQYDFAITRLRAVLNVAGSVFTVSPPLVKWLEGLGAREGSVTCIPCCVPGLAFSATDRQQKRSELSLERKIVFVYLGTITRYQHIEDGLARFFGALQRECEAAHLLCLTNDETAMRRALCTGGVPLDRTTILRVPHRHVASYLSAADAALLLRAPSQLNRFSCPTKFGEYLGSGLPVIVSRGMGSTDLLVENAGAGVVVDFFNRDDATLAREAGRVLRALHRDGGTMRERALSLCEQQFLWTQHLDRVREAYERALPP